MSLFDDLMLWDKAELAKSLAQHARENAALRDEVGTLSTTLFWMKVKDKMLTHKQIEDILTAAEHWASRCQAIGVMQSDEGYTAGELAVAMEKANLAHRDLLQVVGRLHEGAAK